MRCHHEVSEVSRSDRGRMRWIFKLKATLGGSVKRWAPWCFPPASLCTRWPDYQQALSAPPSVVKRGSIWKQPVNLETSPQGYEWIRELFTAQREIRLRGISPKFSPTEAAALLSGLELAVCSDGWNRTVSGHEPASPCLLVCAFFFFADARVDRASRDGKKNKKWIRVASCCRGNSCEFIGCNWPMKGT